MDKQLEEAFTNFWDSIVSRAPEISVGIFILVIFITVGYFVRRVIRARLGKRVEDPLLVNFIGRISFLIIALLGIILFLGQVGLSDAASSILAGAGVGALVLGFAFKDIGENFIAGFLLAVSRPFSIGDILQIDSFTGTVKALDFRNTHIRTFDGRDIFVPNAIMVKNTLTNFTRDGLMRHDFVVGIDYEDNVTQAIEIVLDEISHMSNIVSRKDAREDIMPFVIINNFGASTVDLKIHFWINTKDFLGSITVLKSQVMEAVFKRLKKDGFTLPATIIELKIYQEGNPIPIKLTKEDFQKKEADTN